MTDQTDLLHRFVLERAGVRGALVQLSSAWKAVAGRADYPPALRDLLGQGLVASALLTANIKVDGQLSLELKSAGALRMLFAECNENGRLRGLARWDEDSPFSEHLDLTGLPQAILAITLGDVERGHRYQGLVELNATTLSGNLEVYFVQSEQLPTRLLLAADADQAVGLMLQKLPGEGGHEVEVDADGWNRIEHLLATVDQEELLQVSSETLLYRLFHQESVSLFEPQALRFGCSCSVQRVEQMLRGLGADEVDAALSEQDGKLEVICEFCAQEYHFDRVDVARVFSEQTAAPGTSTTQ